MQGLDKWRILKEKKRVLKQKGMDKQWNVLTQKNFKIVC